MVVIVAGARLVESGAVTGDATDETALDELVQIEIDGLPGQPLGPDVRVQGIGTDMRMRIQGVENGQTTRGGP